MGVGHMKTRERIGFICEAKSDRRSVRLIAARIIGCNPNAFGEDDSNFVRIMNASSELRERHPRAWKSVFGDFSGQVGSGHALSFLRAILLIHLDNGTLEAVVAIKDTDGDETLVVSGLEAARRESQARQIPLLILVATPHGEMESWLLMGFEPQDENEKQRLARLSDPRHRTHELPTKRDRRNPKDPPKTAKDYLDDFIGDDQDRRDRCLTDTDMAVLLKRGVGNRFAAFVDELKTHLVPAWPRLSREIP